jgi:hypothetical protein
MTMQHIQAIPICPAVRARRIDPGRMLALIGTAGLVLLLSLCLTVGVVVRAGIAPQFDQSLQLYAQHVLVLHNGIGPTCPSFQNPPQYDCLQSLQLYAQHVLVLHNGIGPTCPSFQNPPQRDCLRIDPEPRLFSVDYLTPYGIRSLVLFHLPGH